MEEVLTAVEVNCATGEETIRPLTAEEIAQLEADRAAEEAERLAAEQEAAAVAAAKEAAHAKLAALGLTDEEIASLTK